MCNADAGYASGKATSAVARSLGSGTPSKDMSPGRLSDPPITLLAPAATTAAAIVGWLAAPAEGSAAAFAAVVGFAAMVALLVLALSGAVGGRGGMAAATVDRVLLGSFCVFLFVAWCFNACCRLTYHTHSR